MVTVIITTYGANTKLLRAIESVLWQSYKDLEVVVVDDNNPDSAERKATESMMLRYREDSRVRYIKHNENKNGAAARNTGISNANGEYIAFLDDDDYYLPKKIEKSVILLDSNHDLVGVCQRVVRINNNHVVDVMHVEDGHILTTEDVLISKEGIGSGSNIFVCKEVVDRLGGFDTQFQRKQDIEFILRVVKSGPVVFQGEVQIVKDVSGIRRLNYENNRNALIQFVDKFRSEIDELTQDKRKEYFTTQYTFLYNVARLTGNREIIKKAAEDLSMYDRSAVEKIKKASLTALEYRIVGLTEIPLCQKLIEHMRNKRYVKMQEQIIPEIGQDKYSEITEWMGIHE